MRHLLFISSILLLGLCLVANAEPPNTDEARSLFTLIESLETVHASADCQATAPEDNPFSEQSSCNYDYLCFDDADCAEACPTANNPQCVDYVCDFGTGGGGGGGGGGGAGSGDPDCRECQNQDALCFSSADCLESCPAAASASCVGYVCSFTC